MTHQDVCQATLDEYEALMNAIKKYSLVFEKHAKRGLEAIICYCDTLIDSELAHLTPKPKTEISNQSLTIKKSPIKSQPPVVKQNKKTQKHPQIKIESAPLTSISEDTDSKSQIPVPSPNKH